MGSKSQAFNDVMLAASMGLIADFKTVHKFGRNDSVSTTLVPITNGGLFETPTSAQALEILSSNVNDTSAGTGARSVTIEGLDGTGAEQTETVSLNGTTPVNLVNNFLRVNRMYVETSGTYATSAASSHAGDITLRDQGGLGSDWAKIVVNGGGFGLGQSLIACYTVPLGWDAYVLGVDFSVESTKSSDLYFFKREGILDVAAPFKPMRVKNLYEAVSGTRELQHWTKEKYPELTDIGFMGTGSAGGDKVAAEFELLLVKR